MGRNLCCHDYHPNRMHTREPNDHVIHDIVDDVHMEGKYLYKGARKTNGNVNTFKTSDKQAINMIAGALHVLKALTQSMHLLKRTISVLFPIE